jgi:hypothetical protein
MMEMETVSKSHVSFYSIKDYPTELQECSKRAFVAVSTVDFALSYTHIHTKGKAYIVQSWQFISVPVRTFAHY